MKKAVVLPAVAAVAAAAWLASPVPQEPWELAPAGASPVPRQADFSGSQADRIASGTQVMQRARLLHIDGQSASTAWTMAADTIATNSGLLAELVRQPLEELTFDGTTFSALNELIAGSGPARITVTSPTLKADTTLNIERPDLLLDFAGAAVDAGVNPPLWLVRVGHTRNVAVVNAKIDGGRNGFLVDGGSNIAIDGNSVGGLTENGVVITGDSTGVDIHGNQLTGLGRAGVMLHGPVTRALVRDNDISRLHGDSNWNAGILLTNRPGDVAADPDAFFLPDRYWVVMQTQDARLKSPSHNVIVNNSVREGLSSGIYTDGAVQNVFVQNRIEGNSKEGICFDNGATSNVFAGNLVAGNGRRWGQEEAALALDAVLDAGRGPDGLSMAKLPGISIDIILGNHVSGNYGGGIKMVRTALFNVVTTNAVIDNNLGASDLFHFYGIEFGAAPADEPVDDLDFVGSSGNFALNNAVAGPHYAGIFVANGSVENTVFDNEITGAQLFAIEFQPR
jgi:parallel beta-helix repeat protein